MENRPEEDIEEQNGRNIENVRYSEDEIIQNTAGEPENNDGTVREQQTSTPAFEGWLPPLNSIKSTMRQAAASSEIMQQQDEQPPATQPGATWDTSEKPATSPANGFPAAPMQPPPAASPMNSPKGKGSGRYVSPIPVPQTYFQPQGYSAPGVVQQYQPTGYAGAPYGVPPYAQPITFPPVFPAIDTTKPLSVLGAKPLTESEERILQKERSNSAKNGWLKIVYIVGLFLNLLVIWARSYNALGIDILSWILIVLFIGIGMELYLFNQYNERRRKKILHMAVGAGDRVHEIYADRIVSLSTSSQLTLYYDKIRTIVETPQMLILIDSFQNAVVFRAADMIPFDVQKIRQIIYPRLANKQFLFRGTILPQLQNPLPIPIIDNHDKLLFSIPPDKAIPEPPPFILKGFSFAFLLFPVVILPGMRLATAFNILDNWYLNMVLFTAICFIVLAVAVGLIMTICQIGQSKRCGPVFTAITRQGLATCQNGAMLIYPWNSNSSRIRAIQTKEGLTFRLTRLGHEILRKSIPILTIDLSLMPESDKEAMISFVNEQTE